MPRDPLRPSRSDPRWVASRFDRVAPFYRWFERFFAVPAHLRPEAIRRLRSRSGDHVLSVGCGQGPCLPYLSAAVGTDGRVTAIDLSTRMLATAHRRKEQGGLHNVTLLRTDLFELSPEPVNAVFFGFSLTTFGDPQAALRRVWQQLAPGGRLVVMDACIPRWAGRWITPLMPALRWFLLHTVLGDPDMDVLRELRCLGVPVQIERFRLGAYFIAQVAKPEVT